MRSNLRTIHGWKRRLLPFASLRLVRRLIGGMWERYVMPNGHTLAWYPVTFWGGKHCRPHLFCMGKGHREDYTPRVCADCECRPAALPHDYCLRCLCVGL